MGWRGWRREVWEAEVGHTGAKSPFINIQIKEPWLYHYVLVYNSLANIDYILYILFRKLVLLDFSFLIIRIIIKSKCSPRLISTGVPFQSIANTPNIISIFCVPTTKLTSPISRNLKTIYAMMIISVVLIILSNTINQLSRAILNHWCRTIKTMWKVLWRFIPNTISIRNQERKN